MHWSREYEPWTVYGEIDLVIVNQAGMVLVIEQKNGEVDESEVEFIKAYSDEQKNFID